MLLTEAKARFQASGQARLSDCLKLGRTLTFRRKYDQALRNLEEFLAMCEKPVIACGGGKDSTAAAILARHVDPNLPIVCGDPPNPLCDREKHLRNLAAWLGGDFLRVPYGWDVSAVLAGEKPYPDGLKMRVLSAWHKKHGVDGVIFGIRAAESRVRRMVYRSKGPVYRMLAGWRCLPVASMSAEEVLCVAMLHDAPVNPVYTRQKGNLSFEHIRDGTWWPHGIVDNSQWMREYYPEHYADHMAARAVCDPVHDPVCAF